MYGTIKRDASLSLRQVKVLTLTHVRKLGSVLVRKRDIVLLWGRLAKIG